VGLFYEKNILVEFPQPNFQKFGEGDRSLDDISMLIKSALLMLKAHNSFSFSAELIFSRSAPNLSLHPN
jgi:hypothetical protein